MDTKLSQTVVRLETTHRYLFSEMALKMYVPMERIPSLAFSPQSSANYGKLYMSFGWNKFVGSKLIDKLTAIVSLATIEIVSLVPFGSLKHSLNKGSSSGRFLFTEIRFQCIINNDLQLT